MKKGNNKIIVLVAAIIVIIISGALIFAFSDNKKESTEDTTTKKTTFAVQEDDTKYDNTNCQKLMSDNNHSAVYQIFQIKSTEGRIIYVQNVSKRIYKEEGVFLQEKKQDKNNKEITYDKESLSAFTKYERNDFTKDNEGNDLVVSVTDYTNSLIEQGYECK